MERVGILAAAGRARRLAGVLTGSKEAQVVRGAAARGAAGPAIGSALGQMQAAGARRVVIVLREGKADVRAALASSTAGEAALDFVMTPGTGSVVETVGLALPRLQSALAMLAWPDVVYEPRDALARVADRLEGARAADVALGLFDAPADGRFPLVEVDERGVVRALDCRPAAGEASLTWALAVWRPSYSALHREFVANRVGGGGRELAMNDVLQAAMEAGLRIVGVRLPAARFHDIGTPDDLERARGDAL